MKADDLLVLKQLLTFLDGKAITGKSVSERSVALVHATGIRRLAEEAGVDLL